ncbi:type VI secretion system baseplate subunit TssE [Erythrobacter sp. GH1-10]|uniref:type VI secretion system baseplate subunit TssE n=1 Tax=Erythrobacter sp. GH1-10 TaxID=3349334 RepID=UPI003878222F
MPVKIRLTPTIFDKLVSGNDFGGLSADADMPTVAREDFRNFAVANVERFTEKSLRASVLRDLAWLLNTISFESACDLEGYPRVRDSVVNFGVRDFAGRSHGRESEREQAREIRSAIRRFEPRIDPNTLRVEPQGRGDSPGKVSFLIEGEILGGPQLMPLRLRTDIDLESQTVEVRE